MKVLILGATTNEQRYAYKAAERLTAEGYEIVPVGIKKGVVFGKEIINDKTIEEDIHTVTLYIGAERQKEWYSYLLQTNPKRVIFNPGAENEELAALLEEYGIETIENCTLVMLSLKHFS